MYPPGVGRFSVFASNLFSIYFTGMYMYLLQYGWNDYITRWNWPDALKWRRLVIWKLGSARLPCNMWNESKPLFNQANKVTIDDWVNPVHEVYYCWWWVNIYTLYVSPIQMFSYTTYKTKWDQDLVVFYHTKRSLVSRY